MKFTLLVIVPAFLVYASQTFVIEQRTELHPFVAILTN